MKNSIKTVELLFKDEDRQLSKVKLDGNQPLPNGYWPELEQSGKLSLELESRYMKLIGILCWALEPRCTDIFVEVVLMSQYSTSPLLGHIESLYHMFESIIKHEMYMVVFDTIQQKADETVFVSITTDWKYLYGDIN